MTIHIMAFLLQIDMMCDIWRMMVGFMIYPDIREISEGA